MDEKKKRKSGIPTGNAGEYLVMGELLRRGFDAQLADRNTKGYDLMASPSGETDLKRIQVKTVRSPPWYVKLGSFEGKSLQQVTVYVLLGKESSLKPVRFFVARNSDLVDSVHRVSGWRDNGFMSLKAVAGFEDKWNAIGS